MKNTILEYNTGEYLGQLGENRFLFTKGSTNHILFIMKSEREILFDLAKKQLEEVFNDEETD